jgi:hypothetical protein
MATLRIGQDVDNETLGSSVEVNVTISALAATLDSYRFDVSFSPAVLSALPTNPGTVDNAAGTISGIARNNIGLNFGGTLLQIHFNAIGVGTAFLSIPTSSVTLLDSNGNKIPFTTKDGKVFVAAPPPI